MTRQEKFDKLKEKCYNLYLWYNIDLFKEAQFLLAELRIEFAELRFKQRKWEARRKQQERIYINKYKNDTDFKSDTKCKAKFEDDYAKEIMRFRDLRWEVEMFWEILLAYKEMIEAIKSAEIDRKFEDKQMK